MKENLKTIKRINNNSVPYLAVVSLVQGIVLRYGYEQSVKGTVLSYPLDSFFEECSVLANGDVYEIWFGELSNAVITPMYNGAYEQTCVLVTLILGDGWNVHTFSNEFEFSSMDEESMKELASWIKETLDKN